MTVKIVQSYHVILLCSTALDLTINSQVKVKMLARHITYFFAVTQIWNAA